MEQYYELLATMPLFAGVLVGEIGSLLNCLGARIKVYEKNQIIFHVGQPVSSVGIILEGNVYVQKEDFMGNRSILADLGRGDLFAEAFCCAREEQIPVSVLSSDKSTILLMDYGRIISTCPSACTFHAKLIENMLYILARKNIMLNQKIECLSKRTTREKLLAFLFAQAQKAKSQIFNISFNRQELADYLCVDRSAMSNELSKLKSEGIVTFHKSTFKLLTSEVEE
jgi:CRP-like cAMP-binding protein